MSDAIDGSGSLPPGSVPVAPGQVLAGKYRVDRILGVGGMGVVVAATHLQLDQKVALKFMLPAALRHPSFVERFAREARAAVRLRSDHVARVLDVGMLDSGSPYMVMEYLEGSDLGSIVGRQGRMPIETAVDCVLQACDAVAEAHSIGIVHRDLKPANLFMTLRNDGRALVKVLDFGISKSASGGDLSLTRTTEVIGSPNYMSPEQLKSAKGADERSDIWALGVILYELLTGQVPFVAESVTQLTAMVFTEPPRPIESLRPDIPRELSRVIDRCLEKNPAQRFASVARLAFALQPFAPADSRELAARIARIALGGAKLSSTPVSLEGDPAAAVGTSANWSGSGKSETPPSAGRRIVAIVAIVVVACGVALIGALVAMRPGRTSTAATSLSATTAIPTAPAIPTATLTPTSTSTSTSTAPATATATPTATATSTSTSTPTPTPTPTQHSPHDRPSAPPSASPSSPAETPHYRTNW